jgi:RecA-family ATPase
MGHLLEVRLALKTVGFSPIPCKGKVPSLPEWQHMADVSAEEMATWVGANTGMLTRYTPTMDVDITSAEAAEAVEAVVKELYEGHGEILVRIGSPPKRAIPFRTAHPFPKMSAHFVAPNGERHKIEFLCDGQQVVVDGIHPDTRKPYAWHGYAPWDIKHADLPELEGEEDAAYLLDYIAGVLHEQLGFERVQPNGNGAHGNGGEPGGEVVDVDQQLADVQLGGGEVNGVHSTELRCTAKLLRQGMSVDVATTTVLEAVQARMQGDPRAARWNWKKERTGIERMCFDLIKNNPELATSLPDELRDEFVAALAEGKQPAFEYRAGRWRMRGGKAEKPGEPTAEQEKPRRPVEARPFERFDPADLPVREWLYGKHYQRGIVTATVGPGGGGKSSLSLVELMAMCTGRPLLDEQPEMRCRAWYHNAEDSRDEIYRRIAAICQHYDIDQGELEGWLFVTSGLDMPIKIATSSRTGTLSLDKVVAEAIIGTIANNEIAVTSFDPLVAHHAGVENATGDMDQIIREFARVAHTANCSIDAVHHTRKPAPGQEELSVADSRGAGAIINAVRSARVLNVMSKSEAETAGVDDVDRRLHFRIDTGKANMAPPTASRWHKFVGVELPNGDNVGIATPWAFPGQEGSFSPQLVEAERAVEHVFMSLLVRFTLEGRSVSDRSGTNYAPHLFAEQAEAKVAKATKARLKAAMNRLFTAKRIRVERKDKRGGRAGYVLVVV